MQIKPDLLNFVCCRLDGYLHVLWWPRLASFWLKYWKSYGSDHLCNDQLESGHATVSDPGLFSGSQSLNRKLSSLFCLLDWPLCWAVPVHIHHHDCWIWMAQGVRKAVLHIVSSSLHMFLFSQVCLCVIYCFYFTLPVLYKTCWFNIKACHKTHTWKIEIYVWFCKTKQKSHLQSLCFSCVFCHWKKERRKKEERKKKTDCYPFSLFKGGNCSKAAVRCNVPILIACSLSVCFVYAWFGCELLAYLHFVLIRFN